MGTREGVPSQLNAIPDVHRDDRPFVLSPGGQIRMQIETLIHQERGLRKPERFFARAEQDGHPVTTRTLDDLYHGLTPAVVPRALRWPDAG